MIETIKNKIIDIPDFPKEGIMFKDIMPLLEDVETRNNLLKIIVDQVKDFNPEAIVGIESRGFFLGMLIANQLQIPFIPIRKKGKLPGNTLAQSYSLEYGEDKIEIQKDRIEKYQRILIHDDVLATGGTCEAACKLLKQENKTIAVSFLMELSFLNGKEKINKYTQNIYQVITY
jgi:adenine phosphoribosyltransferase